MQKSYSSLYSNFILNLYIVFELNNWPDSRTSTFPPRNCLFGTVKLVRNVVKRKLISNGQGITFDGEGLWRFGNDFARNVVIFDADNRSSTYTNNQINNFVVLGE